MSEKQTKYPNRPGIIGWLKGGRRGIEGYLYLLHRISGLALLLFLTAHVFFTSVRLLGQEAWQQLMTMTNSPVFEFLEYLVYAAFAFHAFNGLRLVFIEFGWMVGKPDRPVYPYKGSVHKQRPLMIVMMIITAVLIAVGGFELLRFPH